MGCQAQGLVNPVGPAYPWASSYLPYFLRHSGEPNFIGMPLAGIGDVVLLGTTGLLDTEGLVGAVGLSGGVTNLPGTAGLLVLGLATLVGTGFFLTAMVTLFSS